MSGSLAVRSSWTRYYGKRMSEYADNWRCDETSLGVAEAIERVCRQAGVSARELQAGSRRRPVSKIRALLAQRLVSEFGLSLAEVARQLGVSLSAIAEEFTEARQTELFH